MTTTKNPVGWFEIAVSDIGKAETFYRDLFGWDFADGPEPAGAGYRMVDAGEGIAGGLTTAEGGLPERYSIFSIVVPDVAATCEEIKERGGRVLVGPVEAPGTGGLVFANVEDPDGNHFGVFCPPAA